MFSILVIGCGSMGSSLLRGVLSSYKSDITISAFDIHQDKLEPFKNGKTQLFSKPPVDKKFDAIFLCVKPGDLEKTAAWVVTCLKEKTLVVSILAGTQIKTLKEYFAENPVVRAMPNICATVGEAATAVCYSKGIEVEHEKLVTQIFSTIGIVEEIKEDLLDAVTGLSGSGPAYIFMIIEALIDGGVKMGIPRNTASQLVLQTVRGSCEVVRTTGQHTAVLKDRVTTPGGTTIHAVHELEPHGLRSILIDAVVTATNQSKKMGIKT